ncbi:TQO small subunit DoxD [Halanaeroarchaeum sulfurireducens]|uniref:DoxX family protein n=1 Tax=Halanaeroarchaeum sulfurireducens TaxID=1604004 RepID=A0A0F7PD61_9EURY|nr:TQO small subunit DoxD [Halanaeroarchaeum sulfurireducens]AKH98110.1 DoxX family protein [Halanaeroarchaeum sulfurireducens]ALG82504.1 DoxX family protein [Halanaeroarchaeum sulfurireducens]
MTQTIQADLPGADRPLELNGTWAAYWLFILRVVTGWWMFHAGLTKVWETHILGSPFDAAWFIQYASQGSILEGVLALFNSSAGIAFTNVMIPWGELLIGLGILLGAFTRLAAFFGGFLMFIFYFVNAGWSHGMFNSDLMALILFVTIAIFGAGRIWGVDQYLERMNWAQSSTVRALLG